MTQRSQILASHLLVAVESARREIAKVRDLAAKPWREYTEEEIASRKDYLHRQLVWIARRNAAEREGVPFTEPKPAEDSVCAFCGEDPCVCDQLRQKEKDDTISDLVRSFVDF